MALDFELSQQQQLIRKAARDVIRTFEPRRKELREKVIRRREFPRDVWDALAGAGFMGSFIPAEYGGTGLGLLAMAFAIEEMAALGFGNALMVLTAMDALCILRNGPEDVRREFLPRIADGSLTFCFALTEADSGSNTFRIRTRAEKKGDLYVVNGSKTFISGWDVADYALLAVRTTSLREAREQGMPKQFGLSLFVVDTKAPGVTAQVIPTRGIEGLNQFTVFFDDVEVPAGRLVGQENGGAVALFLALNPERILAAATAVGMTDYSLKIAVDYARERKVFGDRPIGAYQAIQHPLAEVKIYQDAVRLLTYRAAWAYDKNMSPLDVGVYANMAKYLAAELALMAVDRSIETLGGNGFSDDFGLGDLWDVARLLRTAPVSKEMILNHIAEHVLELPRSY
jgi:acyl-CoA dehydrogenase